MTESREHHPDHQTLTIPFKVPNRQPSTVKITLQPCLDPEVHGEGLLNIYKDLSNVIGFPYIHATLTTTSPGYASIYGWIQITNTPGEPWVKDVYPPFQDLNYPYAMWGAAPSFVDLPGREGVREYDWTARLFLVYSPDAAMSKTCVPVLGVEWGFWIEEFKPKVKELRKSDLKVWDEHLEMLRGEFPGWRFCESPEA